MSTEVICFSIMIGGALASIIVAIRLRGKKEMLISGFACGILVAFLNMMVEYAGVKFDLYHISGPWRLLETPLPLTLGWLSLSFLYCSIYGLVIRKKRGSVAVLVFMLSGIVIGCLTDFLFYRAGIMALGENGSPFVILTVWLVFIPLSIFIYEFFMGFLSVGKA